MDSTRNPALEHEHQGQLEADLLAKQLIQLIQHKNLAEMAGLRCAVRCCQRRGNRKESECEVCMASLRPGLYPAQQVFDFLQGDVNVGS